MQLSVAFEAFLNEYEKVSTRRSYRSDMKIFATMYGHLNLENINSEHVLLWRTTQHERNLEQSTINGRLTKIKRFFNWCVERGLLPQNPAASVKCKRLRTDIHDKAAPQWLLEKMMVVVREQRDEFKVLRDQALLGMLIGYGARRGDAVSARLSRITSTHFTLTVKGGHKSVKMITQDYRPILKDYLALRMALNLDHGALFVGVRRPHRPIVAKTVEKTVRKLSGEAGAEIGPHAIRHWFGQTCADNRIPPTITQALMDHADIKTTLMYYYNQDQPRINAALESLSILGGPSGAGDNIIQFPMSKESERGLTLLRS